MKRDSISASEFKARCLGLLDTVGPDGLTITKHGRPVALLLPAACACAHLIGSMRGIIGAGDDDLLSTGEAWVATSADSRRSSTFAATQLTS